MPSRRVFEAMPPVSWLDIDGIDGALLDGIDALDGVAQVTLRGTALREDTHMDQLASHRGLHTLQSFLPVTDLHLYDAISFARSLAFSGAASRVSDISALSGWRTLEQLHLDSTAISDISALAGLPALAMLNIGNTQVTDISSLAGLPALRSLTLTRLKVGDVSVVGDLPALTDLNLSFVPLDDLSVISRCRGLHRLVLWGAADLSLAPLAALPLQTVEILYSTVRDVAALAGCASLRSLRLVGTEITPADRAALQETLPELRIC
ncbi:MAG: Leucine-rich repeat (LRR) protein [Myxococcota bacterium]